MTPLRRNEELKYGFHNIGPGLAKSFASIIKIGLTNPKPASLALNKYKESQGIGCHGKLTSNSDFMTDKVMMCIKLVSLSKTLQQNELVLVPAVI
jgi:hypothetical protein